MRHHQPLLSATSLMDDNVRNLKGDKLGHVKDIMIDTKTGRVEYYVLSFGGFLGMGNKLFAIPPQAIEVNTEKERLILNVDKDRLKDAPGFDDDDWPNMADPSFRTQVYDYYGYEYRTV